MNVTVAILFGASAVAMAAAPAHAVQATHPSASDARIRFIDYDPYNIPLLYARIGDDFAIVLPKGEKVLDMTGGDTDAWHAGVSTGENIVFMKPKADSPDMNLHINTNKHLYSIDLKLAKKGQVAYQTIFYRFPDENSAAQQAIARKQALQNRLGTESMAVKNTNYTMQGADSLAPAQAWDDGTFTYFRFPANRDISSIYYVTEDGKEHIANRDVDGDQVVTVARIAKKFVFRAGDVITCIFNESYAPNAEHSKTSTVSRDVERTIKGARP